MSSGGGENGPHLRVSAGNLSTNTRRLREDLQTVVRSSLTPLMESSSSGSGGGPGGSPSSLASHLGQSSLQTSATSWQDNITVTVQPQLLAAPRAQSHVLDIEVFQPQQQQQQQQPGADTNNTQQTLDVRDRAESPQGVNVLFCFQSESGWSAILNSNPELKAIVAACEKYIPFLLIILVRAGQLSSDGD